MVRQNVILFNLLLILIKYQLLNFLYGVVSGHTENSQ